MRPNKTKPLLLLLYEMTTIMKKRLLYLLTCFIITTLLYSQENRPNIILVMCDDLGYGDTGFNGSTVVQTPNLDKLAAKGAVFTRFFSGAPVCSPTRGTCLTGRHHFRYGIWKANTGRLPKEEITIPKVLHDNGYSTAHFGKWHLGVPNINQKGKGGGQQNMCLPEWFNYDEHFVTHHSVALYNPFGSDGKEALSTGNPYWHNGERVIDNIIGDDNRIIMDRVVPWLDNLSKKNDPFFMVLWWHTPHKPVDASPEHRAIYKHLSESEQKYYGAITAMDQQMGRMVKTLKANGQLENTMLWFCSDNGPIKPGSTAGLKGSKGQLFNGGVVVPAFLYWEGHVNAGDVIETPCSTLDYLPTIFDIVNIPEVSDRPIDGVSLYPIIKGETTKRDKGIPFRFENSRGGSPHGGCLKGNYKYLTWFDETGQQNDVLYNIMADMKEANDISAHHPDIVEELKTETNAFLESAKLSFEGADYQDANYQPVGLWWSTDFKASGGKKGGKKSKKQNKEKKSKKAKNNER